jgi:hypothetical protein
MLAFINASSIVLRMQASFFKEKAFMDRDESKAKGGFARAESLTPDERKEIARNAALARWDGELPQASHDGTFKIGETVLSAAVLPNGKRVLSQGTFIMTLGRSRTPKAGEGVLSTVDGIPFFLQADVLKPFVTEDLMVSTTPIFFRYKDGQRGLGYDAELLPKVADVYLRFRDACLAEGKAVPRQYAHIVKACDILMRALAHVGIVALVDEATGYQDARARDALAKILEAFVAKELQQWVRTFRPDFYKEMFRLRNLAYNGIVKRPRYIGHLTNDLVYSRLAPGVLDELRNKNPVVETGRRRSRHHQWLTKDIGHPKLEQHLAAVTALMKASDTWDQFKIMIDRAIPVYTPMPLFKEVDQEP